MKNRTSPQRPLARNRLSIFTNENKSNNPERTEKNEPHLNTEPIQHLNEIRNNSSAYNTKQVQKLEKRDEVSPVYFFNTEPIRQQRNTGKSLSSNLHEHDTRPRSTLKHGTSPAPASAEQAQRLKIRDSRAYFSTE